MAGNRTSPADLRGLEVVKHDRTLVLSDGRGDVRPGGVQGLFHGGTRFLSRLELLVDGAVPLLLHSSVEAGHSQDVELACPARVPVDGAPAGHLTLARRRVVGETTTERIRLTSYGPQPRDVEVEFRFAADFLSMTSNRELSAPGAGQRQRSRIDRNQVALSHRGAEGTSRTTAIRFSPMPDELTEDRAVFRLRLEPRAPADVGIEVIATVGGSSPTRRPIEEARAAGERGYAKWRRRCTRFRSSDPAFQRILDRSLLDLRMLQVEDDGEPYVEAGLPWLGGVFGRDALITAYESLGANPDLAWSALRRLAALQGERDAPEEGEEPGRIPHLPPGSGRDLGPPEVTPLWLIVLGAAHSWTGDLDATRALWPSALRALEWIDRWGDPDGDGYVEDRAPADRAARGQEAWDGVVVAHPDGAPASGPQALASVQAYVHAARRAVAGVARALGETEVADREDRAADDLRDRFAADFWVEEMGSPAVALDGEKRPVATVSSGAGHALWCRIVEGGRAATLARTLLSRSMAGGWGVRTMPASHPLFDPLGPRTGAVWPDDNALVAHGLKRAGLDKMALSLVDQVVGAGFRFPLGRYPEMYCGFGSEDVPAPVEHPHACRPHAAAAGAPLLMVRSLCGLTADAAEGVLWVVRPELPAWLEHLEVVGMRVGAARVDLTFSRRGEATSVHVPRKEGDVEVLVRQ